MEKYGPKPTQPHTLLSEPEEHAETVLNDSAVQNTQQSSVAVQDDSEDLHWTLAVRERFDDLGEIGRGGMGSVRRVRDRVILRHSAMKILDYVDGDEGASARFMEEARITGQLDHPNIVPIYDVGVDDEGRPTFFTMKLVRGSTLTEVLAAQLEEDNPALGLERIVGILLKVCDAISFAHSRGVVHRDLKPDNIMVGSYGQVYVMDWGIAKVLGKEDSEKHRGMDDQVVDVGRSLALSEERGRVIGTVAYMAPEQARGDTDEIDERTDVFGLGAILYQALTGFPPFRGSYFHVLNNAREGIIENPERAAPDRQIPPGLAAIAMRALAKSREDRYQSVEAMKADMEGLMRGGGWFPTRIYDRGQLIVREGESSDAAYIIVEGVCSAFKVVDGVEKELRQMGPGEVFGETGVFTRQPRTASVRATSTVKVKVVTQESLDRELHRNHWMGAFVRALAERFIEVDRRYTEVSSSAGSLFPSKPGSSTEG